MIKEPSIVYRYKNALYINLTNRCPNTCVFCLKVKWNMQFKGYNLDLRGKEPDVETVVNLLNDEMEKKPVKEIVFCGYGEAVLRLSAILEIAEKIKKWKKTGLRIRLNTIGLGSLIYGYDITDKLKKNIDTVCISLNTIEAEQWLKIIRPQQEYMEKGFQSVIDFIHSCVKNMPETIITAIAMPDIDLDAVSKFAENAGAKFRLRHYLKE